MASTSDSEENDALVRGFHTIPDDSKLNAMSFAELCSLLTSCEKESPKFLVVEREMKRRLAKDQAEINRPNILLGVFIGGLFTLAGAVAGAFIRGLPSAQPAVSSSMPHSPETARLPQVHLEQAPDSPKPSPVGKKDVQPAGAKP